MKEALDMYFDALFFLDRIGKADAINAKQLALVWCDMYQGLEIKKYDRIRKYLAII